MTNETYTEMHKLIEQLIVLIAKDVDYQKPDANFISHKVRMRNPVTFEDYQVEIKNLDG